MLNYDLWCQYSTWMPFGDLSVQLPRHLLKNVPEKEWRTKQPMGKSQKRLEDLASPWTNPSHYNHLSSEVEDRSLYLSLSTLIL